MTKKQERGALMLEVLAVLALIGVMGPMLYRQVLARNQEISNVNIAAEMRAIKEAMSAAIAADGAILAQLCQDGKTVAGDIKECIKGTATFETAVGDFLPIGMEHLLDDGYGYEVALYAYDVTLANGENYPVVFGVVSGYELAEDWGFKRAARIANLIGTDGGIKMGSDLVGTGGSWKLYGIGNDAGLYPDNVVVATTAIDTFDPDLGATDPNAVAVPEDLAFRKLHAWNYFSVGYAGEGEGGNCFEYNRKLTTDGEGNMTLANDTVKSPKDGGCDPLFWVGPAASGSESDGRKNHVYVKNNLYVGHADSKKSVAFETAGTTYIDSTGNERRVDDNRIVVYNVDGDEKLTIDGQGQIIAYDEAGNEKLKIDGETGRIISSETVMTDETTTDAEGNVVQIQYNYGLDAANTSVLNDVRLGARGGARLSDILPTYISKGMYQLKNSGTTHPALWTQEKPTCPKGYAAAITVTPLKWGSSVQQIAVPAPTTTHTLTAPSGGGTVSGSINVTPSPITKENITQYGLAIEIEGGNGAGHQITNGDSTNWKIKIGYKNDAGVWTGTVKNEEIQALAQTYCVYVGSDDIPEDRLSSTSAITD